MMAFLNTHKWTFLAMTIGAVAGFSYWYFVGCNSGTCMITSKWPNSTLYGALMGFTLTYGRKKERESSQGSPSAEQQESSIEN